MLVEWLFESLKSVVSFKIIRLAQKRTRLSIFKNLSSKYLNICNGELWWNEICTASSVFIFKMNEIVFSLLGHFLLEIWSFENNIYTLKKKGFFHLSNCSLRQKGVGTRMKPGSNIYFLILLFKKGIINNHVGVTNLWGEVVLKWTIVVQKTNKFYCKTLLSTRGF